MTVAQLREFLAGLPGDMPVKFWTAVPHAATHEVRSVHDERSNDLYECCLSDESE